MKATAKAHIAVLCTNLFFACNFSFVKAIAPALVKPFALNVFRVGFSLVLFWSLYFLNKNKTSIDKKDIGRFIWCGITGVAVNQMLFLQGMVLTSTIHAALLMLATPLLITVFAFFILREPVTLFKMFGLALGIGGSILLIATKENQHHGSNYLLGDLFILLNAVAYSVYFILVKPLMQRYSPVQVIRTVFSIGFLFMLPFGWKQVLEVQWSAFQAIDYLYLFLIVLTGTFLAYYFNAYGIQHLGAGTTGSYIYTQPVFAVLIATLFLNEAISGQKLLAGLLIFTGVYMVSSRKKVA